MAAPFASQHSPSFPALLRELGVSLAVSTYQAGQLILLRDQGGVLNTHFCALDTPMGVATSRERLTVGTGFQVWEYANLPAVTSKLPAAMAGCDACYLPRRVHVTGDIDSHELAYAGDQTLWLVNTRMSCLCTLERGYSAVPRWRPFFVSAYDLGDRCHLNGLAMREGAPAYVTALGETDTPGGWRERKAEGGVLLQVDTQRVLARDLSMPHSPRWHGGKLWFLESGVGALSFLDAAANRTRRVAELPGFTRGLDFVGRYAFVGLSQVRETAVFAGLPLTARVAERQCGVFVVDTERRQVVAMVSFSGSVREIFAVQVLPWRCPAVLDMDDPLVPVSYALPDAALAEVAPTDPVQRQLERAAALQQQGALDKALEIYQAVRQGHPENLVAGFRLGVALAEAERYREALSELDRVLRHQPQHAEAANARGHCLARLGELAPALAAYEQAIAVDRQYAAAHFNRGVVLLQLGRYREAWPEYEWRSQLPGASSFPCPQPLWQGQDISEQILLVHTENDLGEALLFARFLPRAAGRCRKLVLVCPESLRELFAAVEGVAELHNPDAIPLDCFDLYCPISGLPGRLDVTLESLSGGTTYLHTPHQRPVPAPGRGRAARIGVAWSDWGGGGPRPGHRLALRSLLPLFDEAGCEWFSLQRSLAREDATLLEERGVHNLESKLTDYSRVAAYLDTLDLLLTGDNVLAHLAGALGKPVWILLDISPQWYWLREREASPWYPTARLFRRVPGAGWEGSIERVRASLEKFRLPGPERNSNPQAESP